MSVVFKYPFSIEPVQSILDVQLLPGSQFLLFDFQAGVPTVWLQIEPTGVEPLAKRRFVLFGTGHPMPEHKQLEHRGSAVGYNGGLVLHCYEDMNP